jgi:hypothetical protein
MPDMAALLAQAAQMQEAILSARDQLANTHVHGTAGGGLVTATVTAIGELVGLQIDPRAVDPADTETLADLVVAAVRDANAAAARLEAQAMGPFTTGTDFGAGIMADLGFDPESLGLGGTGHLPSGHLPSGH